MTSSRQRHVRRHHRPLPTSDRYYPGAGGDSEISCCVKYTVFGFNVIFWILGFALLIVGAWAQIEKNNPYSQLNRLSKFYLDPAWLMIIIGAVTFAIGFSDWHCCGINKPDDWDLNIYFNSTAKALKSEEAGGVPFSCCINGRELENYACGHRVRLLDPRHVGDVIYTEGCLPKLQQWLNSNFVYVGTSIFVVAVIQFLGICFAQDLRSDIFAQRAKWNRR